MLTSHVVTIADINGRPEGYTLAEWLAVELVPFAEVLDQRLTAHGVEPASYRIVIEAVPAGDAPLVNPHVVQGTQRYGADGTLNFKGEKRR